MNARRALYMQSIRGPVLLITVGVLFAIHQAGILSFGRTWPLLFIIIGIIIINLQVVTDFVEVVC